MTFKAVEFLKFGQRMWSNLTIEEELIRLQKLIWLSSTDLIFFSSYNSDKKNLDDGLYPVLICNDTFHYAWADAESFDEKDIDVIIETYQKYSHDGINAWISLRRKYDVISPRRTDKYFEAKKWLQEEKGVVQIDNQEVI